MLDRNAHHLVLQLLVPFVSDADKQTAFVSAAFFGSSILEHIHVGASPRDFAARLIATCATYGTLEDGEPALCALLDELAARVGIGKQAQIDTVRNQIKTSVSISTTTQFQIDTVTLMRYFYDALEGAEWERAGQLLVYLAERPDLPPYFNHKIQQYRVMVEQHMQATNQRSAADHDYSPLRVMAQHESPATVWEALQTFWESYPGYDPDGLARFGREIEYRRLCELADQQPLADTWHALQAFWEMFPGYDPENLAVYLHRSEDGYLEALNRIEEAYHRQHVKLDLSGLALRAVPPEIAYLEHLEILLLADNALTVFPAVVPKLAQLRELSLAGNRLMALPPEIGKLTRLEVLRVSQNALTDIPPEISRLQRLQKLFLHHNRIKSLPPEIGKLVRLEVLDMGNNQIKHLPNSLTQLERLGWLFLNENGLKHVPEVVFRCTGLGWLFLHGNRLMTLPPEIANLHNLRWLSLSYNRIVSLPPELGALAKIEHLAVTRDNPLTDIPHEIVRQGDATVLRWLRQHA